MEKSEAHRLPRVVLNERRRIAVKLRLSGVRIAETVVQCELGRSAVALIAASMRENARQIKPTWKLFLTTNEQPVFPADAAFRGRVHLVPFRADFSEAPETTIDATLRGELPGILAELIALCPSVVREGYERQCKTRPQSAA